MNRSRQLASFILSGGLAVLAVSALAQSSPSTSPSQVDRDRAATSGSASGSAQSSGQQGNTLHGSGGVSGASSQSANVHGFTSMDRDRDGRISLSEFTAASQSGVAAGSGTAGMTGRSSSGIGTGSSGTTAAGAASTRGTTGSTGVDASGTGSTGLGSTSAQMEQEFRRLDTDRDGFLSEAELSTWQGRNDQSGRSSGLGAGATGSTSTAKPDKGQGRDRNR